MPANVPPGAPSSRQIASLLLILSAVEFASHGSILLGAVALFQRDLMLVYFPLVQATLRELAHGALPLRDPTSAFGQPLLADPSCQILYPPAWLQLLLPPPLAYGWFVSLHSVFGALGVALLAYRLSAGSFAAAVVGGCAWLVSGPLLSLATLWHHMAGAGWIPWVWLAVERVIDRTPGRSTLLLGAAMGGQILAGSADMCAGTLLVAALRVFSTRDLSLWRAWVGAVAIALTLGAGVWMPAAEMVLSSGRAAITEAARTYWSLHPLAIVEFFLPVPISAFPLASQWRQVFFEGREPFLASMFLGVALLPLFMAALADPTIPRAIRLPGFLGAAAAILTAFGKHTAFYSMLVTLVPLLKIVRYPSKAMIPAAVLICIFAGVGVASVRRSNRSRRIACAAILMLGGAAAAMMGPLIEPMVKTFMDAGNFDGIGEVHRNLPDDMVEAIVLLALLAGFTRVRSRRFSLVLLVLVGLGHLRQGSAIHDGLNATVPQDVLSYRPPYLEVMRPPSGGRLYVYDYWGVKGRASRYLPEQTSGSWPKLQGLSPEAAGLVTARTYLTPLTGAYWNVEYAWDVDLRMLFHPRLADMTLGMRRVEETPGFLKLLQISGVSRVVAMHEEGMTALTLLAREDFHPKPIRIFGVPDPLPRAFLLSGRTLGTGKDLIDLMNPSFNPRQSVLVDREPARPPAPEFVGAATITAEYSDRLRIETESNAPAFLGLIVGAMPGWRAWVDGRSVSVERANALFIGAEVPAGRHLVEFRLLPATAVGGVTLTALAALALLHAFVTALRSRPAG